jgi:hypothetical protein
MVHQSSKEANHQLARLTERLQGGMREPGRGGSQETPRTSHVILDGRIAFENASFNLLADPHIKTAYLGI